MIAKLKNDVLIFNQKLNDFNKKIDRLESKLDQIINKLDNKSTPIPKMPIFSSIESIPTLQEPQPLNINSLTQSNYNNKKKDEEIIQLKHINQELQQQISTMNTEQTSIMERMKQIEILHTHDSSQQ